MEKKADVDREWSAEEIAGTHYIAFQGGVYDLEDFAVGHPGGADLVSTSTPCSFILFCKT